ncbi:MAG: protein phosphatase 2C domain-containing protein [Pseudomonadota bacterium]
MHWSSSADTHQGNYRQRNQDAVLCSSGAGLWAVADGMGGHNAGEFASESIVRCLADINLDMELPEAVDLIEDRLLEVNDELRRHARLNCGGETVGSTVVVLIARGHVGVALWAGDSRLYRLRERKIELVTRDHNPVADLLDVGGVTEEEALNADTHIITRAVGGQSELHLDVAVFDIRLGDTLLLCSDGLYREVMPHTMFNALQLDVDQAVATLLDECLQGEARDNISVVVARAEPGRE